jgi:type VI secretion system protein ImpF
LPDAEARVCAAVEESIARFEPRLTNVQVFPDPSADPKKMRLEFRIQGTLRMEPSPDVSFVTVLKLATGETAVQQAAA